MAEEKEFEVIDKRRVKADAAAETPSGSQAEATASAAASTTAGGGVTAEEVRAAAEAAAGGGEADAGEMPQLDVPGALSVCVNMLNEVAWMKMGLIPNPMSGKIEKDLAQAKIAIDAVGDLVTRLEPLVADTDRRDLQVMLSNLRINFVQQSQRG